MSNVYYDPEELGLEQLGTLDEPNMSYEYNTFLAVKHTASGRVFSCSDSGCSCPTPFERYSFDGPDNTNMDELVKHNVPQFEREVKEWCEQAGVPQGDRDEFLDAVLKELK